MHTHPKAPSSPVNGILITSSGTIPPRHRDGIGIFSSFPGAGDQAQSGLSQRNCGRVICTAKLEQV
jgi:hypothetical protein